MDIEQAVNLSRQHRVAVLAANECGCYFCLRSFHPSEIEEWVDTNASTAICPHCGIDAVLPGVTDEGTLAAANERWFCEMPNVEFNVGDDGLIVGDSAGTPSWGQRVTSADFWKGRMMDAAKHRLEQGAEFPYDADDKWWHGEGANPPPAKDWAHAAARGVLADMNDRGGIKHGFRAIDEDVRAEIVESLAEIIRLAAPNVELNGERSESARTQGSAALPAKTKEKHDG